MVYSATLKSRASTGTPLRMSEFEDFWLRIGDRIAISTPPAERSIEVRRVLAARAFERWRIGKLDVAATIPKPV